MKNSQVRPVQTRRHRQFRLGDRCAQFRLGRSTRARGVPGGAARDGSRRERAQRPRLHSRHRRGERGACHDSALAACRSWRCRWGSVEAAGMDGRAPRGAERAPARAARGAGGGRQATLSQTEEEQGMMAGH
eukprot:3554899-Rhodomonas_salina.4